MSPRTGTREEWLTARRELLAAEKEHTRRGDELARQRQALPWVPVEKAYVFTTTDGPASLADLFDGRSQLFVQHVMFPGCPSCSSFADSSEGFLPHLLAHDVTVVRVSRYPVAELEAHRRRMGWTAPYVSSLGSSFNADYGVAVTDAGMREASETGRLEYNLHSTWDHPDDALPAEPFGGPGSVPPRDLPGFSTFALADGVVHHCYSAYARGTDGPWGMYQWLDRMPRGRNEGDGPWLRLKDEYPTAEAATAAAVTSCH